jgi:hypothetical protein
MNKLFYILIFLLISSLSAFSQITTAKISGKTISTTEILPFSHIEIVNEATNKKVFTTSDSDGKFVVVELQPGTYTISATQVGYESIKIEHLQISLGVDNEINLTLKESATELQEIVVTSESVKKDITQSVKVEKLNTLPAIGRSLSDFTRLTPQSNNNSFAGTNFRYNNITLDGAVNNDAIGFSNSFGGTSGGGQAGTAGSGARINPYSLDAIQEVQVQIAPFDVKLGNFTGGSVNAITKSGGNQRKGDAYFFGRNKALTGLNIPNSFYDYQTGLSLSGKIKKDKLFYFVNGEITRRYEPTIYNAGADKAAITLETAQLIADRLKNKYGYDVGNFGAYGIRTNSDKLFGRLDWDLSSRSSLMVRGIYTSGLGDNLERSSTQFQFGSMDFTQHTKQFSFVTELKTRFNDNLNNTLISGYTNVHDWREYPGQLFPMIDIGNSYIWAGTWREASVYNTKQKTFEFTDNLTYKINRHIFTLGTHNEFYNIDYGFVNAFNGRYEYANIDAFLADKPSRVRGTYLLDETNNNRDYIYNNSAAKFNVNMLSAYLQDEIDFGKLKLSPGLRFDYSFVPNSPETNPLALQTTDYQNPTPSYTHTPVNEIKNKWLGKAAVSPRLGFNAKLNKTVTIRGGSGVFVGRLPFAWLGYSYYNTGLNYGNIDFKPNGAVVELANPSDLKTIVQNAGGSVNTVELNLIDNNFKLPKILRNNVAVDFNLNNGWKVGLDALYTKTLYDVKFQQINLKDDYKYYEVGPTQSPIYAGTKINTAFANTFLLSNTTQGYRYNFTGKVEKQSNLFDASVAYTYGLSKDLSNGIRNSFQSNYEYNPAVNPQNPSLSYSNFDLRHRFVSTATFHIRKYDVSLFHSSQSGSPYTWVYSSNGIYGNGSNSNLVYIPKDRSEIALVDYNGVTADQQWEALDNYIKSDKYLNSRRGQYAERNGARTPWNNIVHMKVVKHIYFNNKEKVQLSLDVFNLLNLIQSEWGKVYFVPNTNNYTIPLLVSNVKGVNGKIYQEAPFTPWLQFKGVPATYTVDPINSKYQINFGIKYIF